MTSINFQLTALIDAMNDKPIAFNRHYVGLGCGINGALMLSQMVYWSKRTKDKNGFFYKTQDDWELETGLTRWEQETARKRLRELGFVSEHKHGVPCKVHFRVEHDVLYQALIQYAEKQQSSMWESHKLECGNPTNKHEEIRQTNTENTTEITTESLGANASTQAKSKFSVKKTLKELGVTDQTISEYIESRNKKKKTITETVIKLVVKQAQIAGISCDRAFKIVAVKNWDSFKASYAWQEISAELDQLDKPVQPQPEQQKPQIKLPAKPKGFLGGAQ